MDPPISSAAAAAAPLFLPQISPIGPPISASMAAFSPGSQVGGQRHRMDSNKKMLVEVIAASTALCGVILFSLAFVWSYYRKSSYKSPEKKTQNSDAERALAFDPPRASGERRRAPLLDYKLLETATNKFGGSNVIGGGGVGCVYRGKLDDNSQVAVKKLDGGGDDNAEGEFENEVNLLSKLQHLNVISLLGYCVHGDARLTVYELMQNGSLETQLHGPSNGSALTWHIRMKIALDTARGLEYLHEYCNPPVLHRDLKSSNILLDSDFSAKLSDFGLAVIAGAQNDNGIKPSGTLGYMAPEYILDGKLTDKSDVYAFGVVLLELLLGKKPVEKMAPAQCQSIVTWAMPQLVDRSKLPNIVDPVIRNTMDLKHLYQVAAVAVLCVQPEPSYRPLITDVLHSLIPLVPMELGGTLRVRQTAP